MHIHCAHFILQCHHMLMFMLEQTLDFREFGTDKATTYDNAKGKTKNSEDKGWHFRRVRQRKQAYADKRAVDYCKAHEDNAKQTKQ